LKENKEDEFNVYWEFKDSRIIMDKINLRNPLMLLAGISSHIHIWKLSVMPHEILSV
jgi:hypothetical protein